MSTDRRRPATVLLVDDNPGDLRLIKEAFREAQSETKLYAVSNGEHAIDFLYQNGEYESAPEPDVILLDWYLPKMDGKDVLIEIEAHPADIPTVVMSGTDAETGAIQSQADQADAFLVKPSDPTEYVEIVNSVF